MNVFNDYFVAVDVAQDYANLTGQTWGVSLAFGQYEISATDGMDEQFLVVCKPK